MRTDSPPPANYRGLVPASPAASAAGRSTSRKRDTSCEILLRAALTAEGLRYRLSSDLLGKPDIVFVGARVAVFADGDFWHGRQLEARLERLASGHNAPYWVAKIRGNAERDARVTSELEASGWLVLRVWESDIKRDASAVAARIAPSVRARQLKNRSVRGTH